MNFPPYGIVDATETIFPLEMPDSFRIFCAKDTKNCSKEIKDEKTISK